MTEVQVAKLVNKYLDAHRPEGVPIEVVEKGFRQDGDWWYVPVRLTGELRRYSHYYDELADAEIEIVDSEHINVLFVPVG